MNWEHVDRDTKVYVSFRHLDVFNPSKSIWSAQILYMEQNGPETEMAQPRPAASAADRRTALFETNCAPVRRTASLGRASWATNDVLMDRFYDILPKTMCSYCMYCLFLYFKKFISKVREKSCKLWSSACLSQGHFPLHYAAFAFDNTDPACSITNPGLQSCCILIKSHKFTNNTTSTLRVWLCSFAITQDQVQPESMDGNSFIRPTSILINLESEALRWAVHGILTEKCREGEFCMRKVPIPAVIVYPFCPDWIIAYCSWI